MLKLYKDIAGVLHYHEAWISGHSVAEHWGRVGDRGQSRNHEMPVKDSEEDSVLAVLRSAIDDGYRPFDSEAHATLLVEYRVSEMGTKKDVAKRHALEDRLNEALGWTGLGECDGGSIGSGTMEACCFVVDFEIAKRVIENDLAGTEFSDYLRIYDESDA